MITIIGLFWFKLFFWNKLPFSDIRDPFLGSLAIELTLYSIVLILSMLGVE